MNLPLETELTRLIEQADESLRKTLVTKVVMSSESLRASGQDRHGYPNWYRQRSERELHEMNFPTLPLNLQFEVPAECPAWHAAELDAPSGRPFRFFASEAFLVATPAVPAAAVCVRVLHGLTQSARETTNMTIEGVDSETSISRVTRTDGSIDITARFAHPVSAAVVIRFTCPERGIPIQIDGDVNDKRLLSAAVTAPEWINAF